MKKIITLFVFLFVNSCQSMNRVQELIPLDRIKEFSSQIQQLMPQAKTASIIMAGAVGMTLLYGILKDRINIQISKPYFIRYLHKDSYNSNSFFSNNFLKSTSETKMAIGCGIKESWKNGLLIGGLILGATQYGSWPTLATQDIIKPVSVALGITGLAALINGLRQNSYFKKLDIDEVKKLCNHAIPLYSARDKRNFAISNSIHLFSDLFYLSSMCVALPAYLLYKRYSLAHS